jgi:hypothetical protein
MRALLINAYREELWCGPAGHRFGGSFCSRTRVNAVARVYGVQIEASGLTAATAAEPAGRELPTGPRPAPLTASNAAVQADPAPAAGCRPLRAGRALSSRP